MCYNILSKYCIPQAILAQAHGAVAGGGAMRRTQSAHAGLGVVVPDEMAARRAARRRARQARQAILREDERQWLETMKRTKVEEGSGRTQTLREAFQDLGGTTSILSGTVATPVAVENPELFIRPGGVSGAGCRQAELRRARSWLYRRRFLQVNTRWNSS